MSDDELREVLGQALEANDQHASAKAMREGVTAGWMVPTHVSLAALRQVEQRAFERAAEVAEGRAGTRKRGQTIAAAIRSLGEDGPALIRDSTKSDVPVA